MKKLLLSQKSDTPHWVGDGFPVRTIFSYNQINENISPFLLMDHAGPTEFAPSEHIRGVGGHPHRGFETVTIVYDGEVEHRDSTGAGGVISKGDVQWMTAASGLIHEEKHSKKYAQEGGPFEMVQLWVNLPKKDKSANPGYQGILNADISQVDLKDGTGKLRVIAGEYNGNKGPAHTFTPINLWDIRLNADHQVIFKVPAGHNTAVFVLSGEVVLNDGEIISNGDLAVLEREGDTFSLKANQDAKILFLGGEPINEPVVGYGPFVMNSMPEIQQAFNDFRKMGQML